MGSKVIGFRVPDDLAAEFEQFCEGAGKTTGEVLRKSVDDLLYPGSGRERLEERGRGEVPAEDLAAMLAPLESAQEALAQQLKGFEERLELVQVDRALTDADKKHYDGAVVELESELANLKTGVNKLVRVVNDNVAACEASWKTADKNIEVSNKSFDRLSRLFQLLEAHSHDGVGKVEVPFAAGTLLAGEVRLADERLGELTGVRRGKIEKPGWKYLEETKKSIM